MKYISILFGKLAIILTKLLNKKGTNLPGVVSKKINKNILSKFNIKGTVIAVTGSSGKGSITSLISNTLIKLNEDVIHNTYGSNLDTGIISLFLKHCDLKGNINSKYIVLEVDERYTKYIFKDTKPKYVLINNLSRDQPPRNIHYDFVFDAINKNITKDMHLIINKDDPYLRKFITNNKVTYYGIEDTKYSYKESLFKNLNITRCPLCNSKLNYKQYFFETLGNYSCTKCNFKRGDVEYKLTDLNFDNLTMIINNKYKVNFGFDMLFSVYNVLGAYTLLSQLNIKKSEIANTISSLETNKKIFNKYKFNNRSVFVLNNKNENATTFNQSMLYINRDNNLKTIVIGWKEISRRYKYDDISWLYDIDFNLMNNIDKVICVGVHKYTIANRIKYAGIDEDKILVFDTLNDSYSAIKDSNGNIYAVVNFDYVEPFNALIGGN